MALDNCSNVRAPHIDFETVFNRIDQQMLELELQVMEISGNCYTLFANYMADRYQYVVNDGQSLNRNHFHFP